MSSRDRRILRDAIDSRVIWVFRVDPVLRRMAEVALPDGRSIGRGGPSPPLDAINRAWATGHDVRFARQALFRTLTRAGTPSRPHRLLLEGELQELQKRFSPRWVVGPLLAPFFFFPLMSLIFGLSQRWRPHFMLGDPVVWTLGYTLTFSLISLIVPLYGYLRIPQRTMMMGELTADGEAEYLSNGDLWSYRGVPAPWRLATRRTPRELPESFRAPLHAPSVTTTEAPLKPKDWVGR